MRNNIFSYLLITVICLLTNSVMANVMLPACFTDNMVLQRNSTVKIWGWAITNEEIKLTASWTDETFTTKTNSNGRWAIEVPTTEAGGPYTINIKGYDEVSINNVMLGEVWLCSGQSNMEWTPNAGLDNAEAEIAAADYPNIRLFTVNKMASEYPQLDLKGKWQVCTPETMKHFSAVAYFFAQRLKDELKNVPIGVINSSWGGTAAEVWIPKPYIELSPALTEASKKAPQESEWCPTEPGSTYNAMIHPLVGYEIAGVLWYQGESNCGSDVYNKTLGGLVDAWRTLWNNDFPFYYVQIAPFKYEGGDYQGVGVRDAQRKMLDEVPNTDMVVISDVSTIEDIHPQNKKPVGVRLGNIALKKVYGKNMGLVDSPLFESAKADGNNVTVSFKYDDGLYFTDKKSEMFELAGEDGTFYPATAKIKGNKVIVKSSKVKKPVQIRYAWHNTAQADLFNKAKLPASSFKGAIE